MAVKLRTIQQMRQNLGYLLFLQLVIHSYCQNQIDGVITITLPRDIVGERLAQIQNRLRNIEKESLNTKKQLSTSIDPLQRLAQELQSRLQTIQKNLGNFKASYLIRTANLGKQTGVVKKELGQRIESLEMKINEQAKREVRTFQKAQDLIENLKKHPHLRLQELNKQIAELKQDIAQKTAKLDQQIKNNKNEADKKWQHFKNRVKEPEQSNPQKLKNFETVAQQRFKEFEKLLTKNTKEVSQKQQELKKTLNSIALKQKEISIKLLGYPNQAKIAQIEQKIKKMRQEFNSSKTQTLEFKLSQIEKQAKQSKNTFSEEFIKNQKIVSQLLKEFNEHKFRHSSKTKKEHEKTQENLESQIEVNMERNSNLKSQPNQPQKGSENPNT